MIVFYFFILVALYLGFGIGTGFAPVEWLGGARIIFLHAILVFGCLIYPLPASLILAIIAGFLWDFGTIPIGLDDGTIFPGLSIVYFVGVAVLLQGLHQAFGNGKWHLHSLLVGMVMVFHLLFEFVYITLARSGQAPPEFTAAVFTRIFGTAIISILTAPLLYFVLIMVESLIVRSASANRSYNS
jgi:hypothetical protein